MLNSGTDPESYVTEYSLVYEDKSCHAGSKLAWTSTLHRDYFIAEQPSPTPHLANPEGCAALRIVLVTVPRVSRSCDHFPDGFDLHLLRAPFKGNLYSWKVIPGSFENDSSSSFLLLSSLQLSDTKVYEP